MALSVVSATMGAARQTWPAARVVLSDDERETLERWARCHGTQQALALRRRIVLAVAEGATNRQIAAELQCNPVTVGKWALHGVRGEAA